MLRALNGLQVVSTKAPKPASREGFCKRSQKTRPGERGLSAHVTKRSP
jgi:hypothetical protein